MLGTNRKTTTIRLNSDRTNYEPCLSTFQSRYEPMVYTNYNIRAKQITWKFYSDLMDIQIADRIIDTDRQWVVLNVKRYTEVLGKHLELLMREIWPTNVHEEVTKKTLEITQSNYDPLLEEREAGSKTYTNNNLLVLLDPWEYARDSIIKMLDSGKVEELDLVMTLDFPEKIVKEDRIVYKGVEYEIKWIIPQPYQYLVWLKKSMVNYMSNQI